MTNFIENLEQSLKSGFIDKAVESNPQYQPKLLTNNYRSGLKILTDIVELLHSCDEFWFSVAFLTSSGIASLHNTLRELESRNIKGKILVSDYLNFTNPEGLKALRRFSNIESRLLKEVNFHGKGYLFKSNYQYDLILGSSNLTAPALSENTELNIKLSATNNSKIIEDTLKTFQKFFDNADPLSDKVILDYEKTYSISNDRIYSTENEKSHYNYFNSKSNFNKDFFTPNAMQEDALTNLQSQRDRGINKSLLISATGTGKTVMAAFDVKQSRAKKMLFVVHRGNIARKAMSTFQKIIKDRTFGLYTGNIKDINADFIFATVQTINNPIHLHNFDRSLFDYIIIDETHRAGAKTYHSILDYFQPKFLLGMTATPERSDNFDIYSLFDHNIGYEIRLQRAMEEKLLSQFHYFGVTDITVNGQELDEKSDFNLLIADERVERIIDISKQYGCDDGIVRGLVFCSRKEEAKRLSELFNAKGFSTIALTGDNSEDDRINAIENLESNNDCIKLDYIFTVDIFNEGVDIPRINQIIMLRPTQSAIIFVQQLGRGLRKTQGKDYLTVIDFIGNYQNNFMIPIALYGDTSYNKDNLRKLLASGSSFIPGASTINFDLISKEKIFNSINNTNISKKSDLIQDYRLLKYRLGKTPTMMDFLETHSRDPFHFVEYFKSYLNFIEEVETDLIHDLDSEELRLLEYFSKHINNGKTIEESLLLELLMNNECFYSDRYVELIEKHNLPVDKKRFESAIRNTNLLFITELSDGKKIPVGKLKNFDIVNFDNGIIKRGSTLKKALSKNKFVNYLKDSTNYSISKFHQKFDMNNYLNGFQRYHKYSRENIHRILNWDKNPNAQNVGGYQISPDKSCCPIFVTYDKKGDISETIKYEDKFISPNLFVYMSKSKRKIDSPDVSAIRNQYHSNMRLPLFMKKSDDEKEKEYYFLGDMKPIVNNFVQQEMPGTNVSVVKMEFELDQPVKQDIYNYITSA